MKAPGPIYAIAPAPIVQQSCPVRGSVFMIATSGLILAADGRALSLQLDPTAMIMVGTLMARAGQALGGDPAAALAELAALPVVDAAAISVAPGATAIPAADAVAAGAVVGGLNVH